MASQVLTIEIGRRHERGRGMKKKRKKNNLRIEHFDGDFGGGVDGPQVGQQSVSTEDGAAGASLARVIRRLDENLVGRTGSFAQCPSHVGQLLLQTATLCEKTQPTRSRHYFFFSLFLMKITPLVQGQTSSLSRPDDRAISFSAAISLDSFFLSFLS